MTGNENDTIREGDDWDLRPLYGQLPRRMVRVFDNKVGRETHMRPIRHRLGLMLGLLPVVLLTAACTSPAPKVTAPKVTATTAPSPRVHEFVSKMYDFRLTLPKDWTGADAQPSDPWDGQQLQLQNSTAFADFSESGNADRSFVFGAAPVAYGTTLAAWQRAMVRASPTACVDVRSTKTTTLGGEPALTWRSNCPDVQTVKFAAVHGHRGYVAIFVPSGDHLNAADSAIYEPIRQSFHFTD